MLKKQVLIKRFLVLSLILMLIISVFTGCNNKKELSTLNNVIYNGKKSTLDSNTGNMVKGVVTKVSDGDTFQIKTNDNRKLTIRPIGVNCPEISHKSLGIKEQPYGQQAKEYTTKRLLNKTVYLSFDVSKEDRYHRTLAYVWTTKPTCYSESEIRSKMYNAELLLNGYAQVMTVQPNSQYADIFVKLQRESKDGNKGLWSTNTEKPNDRYNNKKK